jgi:A/G-specific adenine glycosylase
MINKRIERKKALDFSDKLLSWHRNINRRLPWVGIKDAYRIWLSEIILQQTRVEQGLPYYQQFIRRFPTVRSMAEATEDDVLRLWQGLGYYSRARNMYYTAGMVTQQYRGKFPTSYDELIKLKGIGAYSAAAISSFAANEPRAVVDGNVVRVLARVFGLSIDYQRIEGKKLFSHVAQQLLPEEKAGQYNQAIMDFGALQCTPKNPECGSCVMKRVCFASRKKQVARLPVKRKKQVLKKRYLHFFIIDHQQQVLIEQRTGNDIWKGLYQFPLIETEAETPFNELLQSDKAKSLGLEALEGLKNISRHKQKLSHQEIHFTIYYLQSESKTFNSLARQYMAVPAIHLKKYSFPKTLAYYTDISLYSNN